MEEITAEQPVGARPDFRDADLLIVHRHLAHLNRRDLDKRDIQYLAADYAHLPLRSVGRHHEAEPLDQPWREDGPRGAGVDDEQCGGTLVDGRRHVHDVTDDLDRHLHGGWRSAGRGGHATGQQNERPQP